MATVDRPALVSDVKFWLPDSNTLDDPSLTKITELVISFVGDDSVNYPQILCESLEACAIKNLSDSGKGSASSTGGGIKKETLGGHSKEYFEGSSEDLGDFWRDYIKDLKKKVCPLFGYSDRVIGISIAPGNPMTLCGEELETLY